MKKKYFILILFVFSSLLPGYGQVCTAPTNLVASSVTGTSATIGWTSGGTSSQWEIFVQPAGLPAPTTQQASFFATVNPFVITGLSPCTAFDVYVRTICDPATRSNWSGPLTFGQNSNLVSSVSISGSIATVTATGGVSPYQYTMYANGVVVIGPQASNVFNLSGPGVYDFIVTDATGCTSVITLYISSLGLEVQSLYVDFNNDGFTSVGDVIDYQISVKNNEFSPMTNIVMHGFNATVSGGPIGTLNPGITDATTFTARHVLTQNDINAGNVIANFSASGDYNNTTISGQIMETTALNISSGIRMNAFIDTNNNGILNAGEINVDAGTFNYQVNGGPVTSVSSQSGRHTVFESNPSSVYNVSYAIRPELLPRYSIATADYTNVTVPTNSGITTLNFALTELPYTDLNVALFPYGAPPRPGFTYKNQIVYKNNGNTTIANGILTFTNSSLVSITNVSQSGTTPIANGFTYAFTNLLPNEVRYITVEMQVPTIPTVSLGQVITNTITATGVSGDMNLQNDTANLSQTIVGSYDPNDKSESHGGKILHATFTANDYLNYTIRFENTGTYEAVNVRVNDILDSKLDESTIVTVNASHPYVLERKNNVLNWKFDGIQLPPSVANTDIGHGYITFKIKPKPGYAIGDIIPNTASIYFDFNPAIVTNVCDTEFVNALSTDSFEQGAFTLYPNPTSGMVTIALKDTSLTIDALHVMDVSGKTVLSKTVNDSKAVVDVTSLANGMYFIQLKAGQQEKTIKVVKQ
jgi:uncharacterized repeat protein (TIGR01451 family)